MGRRGMAMLLEDSGSTSPRAALESFWERRTMVAAAAATTTRREAARGLLAGRRVSRHVRRQRRSSCSPSKSSHLADRSRTSGNRSQWRHTTTKHAHNHRSSTSPERRRHGRSSSEKPNDYSCDNDVAAAGERELWVTDSTDRLLHGAHKLRARDISTSGRKRIRGKFRNASHVERRSNRS